MTTTPMTTERLREIAASLDAEGHTTQPGWVDEDGRAAVVVLGPDHPGHPSRVVRELLAEIKRLRSEAQADAGRMLKQYTVNAKLIEGGEHALRIVAKRDTRITALETGLREACDAIEASEGLGDAALYRLRALADE